MGNLDEEEDEAIFLGEDWQPRPDVWPPWPWPPWGDDDDDKNKKKDKYTRARDGARDIIEFERRIANASLDL